MTSATRGSAAAGRPSNAGATSATIRRSDRATCCIEGLPPRPSRFYATMLADLPGPLLCRGSHPALDQLLQLGAGLEGDALAGADLEQLAGARMADVARRALGQVEAA